MPKTAIKTGRGVEASMKSLLYTLNPTIAAIAKALPEDGAGSGSSDTEGANASIKEPLIRLKQLLESEDGEAADFIVDEKARLKCVLTPTEIKTLGERIGNLIQHQHSREMLLSEI
jgi:hypothetical protein